MNETFIRLIAALAFCDTNEPGNRDVVLVRNGFKAEKPAQCSKGLDLGEPGGGANSGLYQRVYSIAVVWVHIIIASPDAYRRMDSRLTSQFFPPRRRPFLLVVLCPVRRTR
jgi:hypothetical protein